jgi:hypothetical protein
MRLSTEERLAMEYEIDDDPQGVPEGSEAARDGGLREEPLFFLRPVDRLQGLGEEERIRQLGEAA